MIKALFYLQICSLRNLVRMRLQRLRQPKYLFSAVAGAAYLYLFFFRRLFITGRTAAPLPPIMGELHSILPDFGAVFLLVVLVLVWLLPSEPAGLRFTEAEIAFLFPAPLSRRALIQFRIFKMQFGMLLSALFLALFSRNWSFLGGPVWIHGAGWWIALSAFNLHYTAAAFMQARGRDYGVGTARRRLWILAILVGIMIGLRWVIRENLPTFELVASDNSSYVITYLQELFRLGPIKIGLTPFHWVVDPFFSNSTKTFLLALIPAAIVLVLHYYWVLKAEVSFEEASLTRAQKRAERVTAIQTGNWRGLRHTLKATVEPFVLPARGPVALAFLWKNLIAAGAFYRLRIWVYVAVTLLAASLWFRGYPNSQMIFPVIAAITMGLAGWLLVFGSQFARQDFRTDLANIDLLKTYPLAGWQIALGQVLAPMVVLTALQWLLLIVVAVGFTYPEAKGSERDATHVQFYLTLGAGLIMPFLQAVLLIIPNATALLFPAWVQVGRDRQRGIELMGQRLILVFGQLAVMALALLPAVACAWAGWFLTRWLIGNTASIFLGAVIALLILTVEAVLGVTLLGRLFDRFDVAEEPILTS